MTAAPAPAGPAPLVVAALPPVRAGVCADPVWMAGFARAVEALGYESIVTVEHPLVVGDYTSRYPYAPSGRMPLPLDCRIPDPLDLLAYLAGVTSTLGLATGVLVLPVHHPAVLAKRLATLDRLSGGRVRLCVGVGWMREELEACGVDFASRGRRADECIDAMRALWADSGTDGAAFAGEFFAFTRAHSFPKPLRPGGVPVHVGGHSPASIRRAARRGDGWQPLGLWGAELEAALGRLGDELEAAGRPRHALEITVSAMAAQATPETVGELAGMGVTRLVLTCGQADLGAAEEEMAGAAGRLELVAPAP
ncbi:MAG TPA: LLM class F420-dependent oxidoreductase [Acidimicrobiales bacterium]|nr:LLM class F420-dependent oxidoreductase [Acidimicrobiales bacterium]